MQELNNVRMSDFQKIVFVNNIDENTENIDNIIKNDNYNFAVFLTKTANKPAGFNSSELINIWHKGQRLNRFIGIDPDHNYLDINHHIIKLMFDYDSGMLRIIDANELNSIIFAGIEYTQTFPRRSLYISNPNANGSYAIDAADNKFYIYLKLQGSETSENIPSAIIYNATERGLLCDNFIMLESTETCSNDMFPLENDIRRAGNHEQTYKYGFRIITDTADNALNNGHQYNYTLISDYDNSKSVELPLYAFVNPVSFRVYNGESNIAITNNQLFSFAPSRVNAQYKIALSDNASTTPTAALTTLPYNYSGHPLQFKVETDNNQYVGIVGGENTGENNAYKIITVNKNEDIVFTLDVCKTTPPNNNIIDTHIYVSLLDTENRYDFSDLQFTISVSGTFDYKLYYFGQIEPTSSFDENNLMTYSEFSKGELLYSWEADNGITKYPTTFDPNIGNSPIWFMIPVASSDDLHLKYNIYEQDESYIATNCEGKKYLPLNLNSDNTNDPLWKLVNSSLNITYRNTNIAFKVYKFTGDVFHGKLQKDV